MRCCAFAALVLSCLSLTGLAQADYHPLEIGSKPVKAKTKPGKLSVWAAKPGAATQLGPETPLFDWSIRPPKEFVSTQKSDGGNQVFIFQGNPRPDNSSPALWVVMGNVRPVESTKPLDEVVMDIYMIQLHQNRVNWKAPALEYGIIKGRRFLRRRWSAAESVGGVTHHLRGTVYLTLVGTKFAAITLQDTEPGANSTLGVMESSALSFHKR
jgi:hypothetical protein